VVNILIIRNHTIILNEASTLSLPHTRPLKQIFHPMDDIDRRIINSLQEGFPISEKPYAEVAERLGLSEDDLLSRLTQLLAQGLLSRFGPLYHAERLGGGLTLAAIQVPTPEFERVANIVNSFPEVAHNYARDHYFNMWFVLATEKVETIQEIIDDIETQTQLTVYNMPKQAEYYLGLKLEV